MKSSKLYLTLQSLERGELDRFQQFVESPYFNKRKELVDLFHIIEEAIEKNVAIEKKAVFTQLLPSIDYNDQTMRQLMSDLFRLLDRFLAYEELTNGEIAERIYTLRAYRKRMLKKQFPLKLNGVKKILKRYSHRDSDYHRFNYLIEAEHNYFLENLKKRDSDPNLQASMDALDVMYLTSKLKYVCHILNFKNVSEAEYRMGSVELLIDEVKLSNLMQLPAVIVYYNIFMALKDFDDDSLYRTMRDSIKQHHEAFGNPELRQLFLFCVNYCIKKILSGNKSFEKEMLSLFKEMIEKDIILENGYLSPWIYKNATVLGLRLEEVTWTKWFLKKYQKSIDPEFSENVYVYNLAKVYFHEKQYSKVIELLRAVEYNDLFYALDSKALLLKTYYELKEYPALYALSNSFNQFIRRQKRLPEAHKNNYLNLVKFTRKAIKANFDGRQSVEKLEQEFEATKSISDRKWIRQKITEIK